jgi:hypothetical protein
MAPAAHEHRWRVRAQVHDGNLCLAEVSFRPPRCDRDEQGLAAGQKFGPQVTGAAVTVRRSHRHRLSSCSGNAIEGGQWGARVHDRAVVSPGGAAWSVGGANNRNRGAAGDRDLLDENAVEEPDPLTIRRNERAARSTQTGQRKRRQLVERPHKQLVLAAIDNARAIGRDGDVRGSALNAQRCRSGGRNFGSHDVWCWRAHGKPNAAADNRGSTQHRHRARRRHPDAHGTTELLPRRRQRRLHARLGQYLVWHDASAQRPHFLKGKEHHRDVGHTPASVLF